MRNKPLIIALCAVSAVLIILLAWWSHHPSAADTTSSVTQATPASANPEGAPLPNVPSGSASTASAPAIAAGGQAATAPRAGTTLVAPVPGANTLPFATPAIPAASGAPTIQQQGMIELDKARRMIRDYHTLMGENPVGTNAEIMKALMGGNPKQATLGPIEGLQLNGKGELIDQWGTPFFFHQLSGDHMEIHSAGPDKIMGTKDDLVLR